MEEFRKIVRSVIFERKDVERYDKTKAIIDLLIAQIFNNKEYVVEALSSGDNVEAGYDDEDTSKSVTIVITAKSLGSPTGYGKYDWVSSTLYFTIYPYIGHIMKTEELPVDLATARVLDVIFADEYRFRKNLAYVIAHELNHHLDFTEFGKGFKSSEEKYQKEKMSKDPITSEKGRKTYMNNNAEYNAFLNQHLFTTINDFDFVNGTWNDFYKSFIDNFQQEYFNYFTDKNKKKIQKRLYDTFVKLKEKATLH